MTSGARATIKNGLKCWKRWGWKGIAFRISLISEDKSKCQDHKARPRPAALLEALGAEENQPDNT